MSKIGFLLFGCVAFAIAACDKKSNSPAGGESTADKSTGTAAKQDEHAGHDHKEGDDHGKAGSHGAEHVLGTETIGQMQVKVVQHGNLTPGKEADFDVFVTQGSPAGVRFWIGSADGKGAMKVKATINKEEAHNHVEVPDPLPTDAKLWVEIESASGKATGSFALKR